MIIITIIIFICIITIATLYHSSALNSAYSPVQAPISSSFPTAANDRRTIDLNDDDEKEDDDDEEEEDDDRVGSIS
jgi:ribosomal protein L12E/L44/L45/RPP1/RPP2